MRNLCVLLVLISFMTVCYADNRANANKFPQGTFVKSRSGKIIQYDKNGKKIGEYKLNSGRSMIKYEKKFKH